MNKPQYRVPGMAEIAAGKKNGLTVVSTFSGCGGSSLGYKMAGFTVRAAVEFIPEAAEVYRLNHPGTVLLERDIRSVTGAELLVASGLRKGELDLLDGSPPCAAFSTAGQREKGWGKEKEYSGKKQRVDDLFYEFVRLLNDLQPRMFVAENVKGLTVGKANSLLGSIQPGLLDDEIEDTSIIASLQRCGYRVANRVLNAAHYGVPQARERLIIIGVRNDIGKDPVYPKELPYRYSIRDALPFIDGPNCSATNEPTPAYLSIDGRPAGKAWKDRRNGEQSDNWCMLKKPDPNWYSPTITASDGGIGRGIVYHPYIPRGFTVAEIKRLCAFPDDFVLTGTHAQQIERMGRAVPPVLMYHIAAAAASGVLL